MRAAALLAMALLFGCTSTERCKDGTLRVVLTLDESATQADALEVTVLVDGGKPATTNVAHVPGVDSQSIDVGFPDGYPAGKNAEVEIVARKGSLLVGRTGGALLLSGNCASTAINVWTPLDMGLPD